MLISVPEILLRLYSPADLARASTACAAFRRLVTDRSFLRRFRSLHHPPPLLGLLCDDFYPADPAAARALAHAADFTFSFLPTPDHWWRWMPLDWRDGRVLAALVPMAKFTTDEGDEGEFVPFPRRDDVTDLAVCDPISRRYVILLAIPGDLITSGEQRDRLFDFNAFLAPATEEEMAGSSFRVVATAQCKIKLFVFVFSSRSEEWRSYQFDSGSIFAADVSSSVLVQADFFLAPRYYAHCRLYWVLKEMDKLLVLDTCEMVFFTIDLERDEHMSNIAILEEAEEDMIGVFSIRTDLDFATRTQLCYTIRQVKADAANGPPLNFDKIIPLPLPMEYMFRIIDAADGYLLLEGRLLDWFECSLEEGRPDTLYFSLESKTLDLRVGTSNYRCKDIYWFSAILITVKSMNMGHRKGTEQHWLSILLSLLRNAVDYIKLQLIVVASIRNSDLTVSSL
uniref:F-box domain-containing protein n=1 Tax=Oryza glumipatula TaxID=40148 RepID=A0A0E0ALA5_9ORYZ